MRVNEDEITFPPTSILLKLVYPVRWGLTNIRGILWSIDFTGIVLLFSSSIATYTLNQKVAVIYAILSFLWSVFDFPRKNREVQWTQNKYHFIPGYPADFGNLFNPWLAAIVVCLNILCVMTLEYGLWMDPVACAYAWLLARLAELSLVVTISDWLVCVIDGAPVYYIYELLGVVTEQLSIEEGKNQRNIHSREVGYQIPSTYPRFFKVKTIARGFKYEGKYIRK